jgi:hypothetical protein
MLLDAPGQVLDLGIADEHGAMDEVILRRWPDGIEPESD